MLIIVMCREPSEPGRPQTFRAFFMWEWKYVCISLLSRGWTSETKLLCISSVGEFILCERDWHKRSDLCFFFLGMGICVCLCVMYTPMSQKMTSWALMAHRCAHNIHTQIHTGGSSLPTYYIHTQLFYLFIYFLFYLHYHSNVQGQ